MNKSLTLFVAMCFACGNALRADVVTDWSQTLDQAVRTDRTSPGPTWAARNIAMMHAAMYDAVNSVTHSHQPFHVDMSAPAGTSQEAAAAQAAYRVLVNLYPGQTSTFDSALNTSLAAIPNGPGKDAGIQLGNTVATEISNWRPNDGASTQVQYTPGTLPGQWRPDPMNPTQTAWGPGWGSVVPFTMSSSSQFVVPPHPDMTSQQYTDAFNEVKSLGALNSTTRTPEQTQIGIFWGYDRAGMGPPPILYDDALRVIATQKGNTLEDNARLFAMATVAEADAGIAAWNVKFTDNFWRPIAAIREADADGNPDTVADPNWVPLGAPGGGVVPDFTPPFPAYVSGHATFGAAVFHTIADFYGTDNIAFTLDSGELPGVTRSFTSLSAAAEENARSRIYLGIHWNFDDIQGRALGNQVADFVNANYFAPVPEPASWVLLAVGASGICIWRRKQSR